MKDPGRDDGYPWRSDPYVRHYCIRLLSDVVTASRASGCGCIRRHGGRYLRSNLWNAPKTAGVVGSDASKRVAKRDQLPNGTLPIFSDCLAPDVWRTAARRRWPCAQAACPYAGNRGTGSRARVEQRACLSSALMHDTPKRRSTWRRTKRTRMTPMTGAPGGSGFLSRGPG